MKRTNKIAIATLAALMAAGPIGANAASAQQYRSNIAAIADTSTTIATIVVIAVTTVATIVVTTAATRAGINANTTAFISPTAFIAVNPRVRSKRAAIIARPISNGAVEIGRRQAIVRTIATSIGVVSVCANRRAATNTSAPIVVRRCWSASPPA
jgi:hypothetical protein